MKLIFYCNQCPDSFDQFKKLVNHYERYHNPDSEQHRRLREAITYSGADSGCKVATEYLDGKQSSCLDCPLKRCIYDEKFKGVKSSLKMKRNEEIMTRLKAGTTVKELAKEFGISTRTVHRMKRVE